MKIAKSSLRAALITVYCTLSSVKLSDGINKVS